MERVFFLESKFFPLRVDQFSEEVWRKANRKSQKFSPFGGNGGKSTWVFNTFNHFLQVRQLL